MVHYICSQQITKIDVIEHYDQHTDVTGGMAFHSYYLKHNDGHLKTHREQRWSHFAFREARRKGCETNSLSVEGVREREVDASSW
jgi:hypothetical protein